MKSKPILQKKPELIVVALLVTFLLAGTAAADINPPMISVDAIGDYLYELVVSVLWIVIMIMTPVGAAMYASGNPAYRARGIAILTGCIVAAAIFYVLPWIISEMQTVATAGGNNTTST